MSCRISSSGLPALDPQHLRRAEVRDFQCPVPRLVKPEKVRPDSLPGTGPASSQPNAELLAVLETAHRLFLTVFKLKREHAVFLRVFKLDDVVGRRLLTGGSRDQNGFADAHAAVGHLGAAANEHALTVFKNMKDSEIAFAVQLDALRSGAAGEKGDECSRSHKLFHKKLLMGSLVATV